MALADFQELVDSLVRAPSDTTSADDRDRAISLAVARYSADAPRQLLEDVTWLTSGHLGPLPADWVEGAYVVQAEHPVGQQPVVTIDLAVYRTPTGQALAAAEALQAGAVVRVCYGVPHVLSAAPDEDTIPDVHREAVASFAAHLLCRQLAALFSSEVDASISADHSNTESRARAFAARSRECRSAYYAGIGRVDPQAGSGAVATSAGQAPAASASAWPGRTRLRPGLEEVL